MGHEYFDRILGKPSGQAKSGPLERAFPLGGRSLGSLGAVEDENKNDPDESERSCHQKAPAQWCQLPRHEETPLSRTIANTKKAIVTNSPTVMSTKLPVLLTAGPTTANANAT